MIQEKVLTTREKSPFKTRVMAATAGLQMLVAKACTPTVFAAEQQQNSGDGTIWSVGQTAGKNLFDNMKNLYCDGLFLPLLALNLILLAVTKDDKKRGVLRYALIVLVVVYIIFNATGTIIKTITDFIATSNIS